MQTMLTVVTQNSRLLRRSALSGDRMAFGFGYPHCWGQTRVARSHQAFLQNRLLAHVKFSRSGNRFRIPHGRVSRPESCRRSRSSFAAPIAPLEEILVGPYM